jgi:hypothetical protein
MTLSRDAIQMSRKWVRKPLLEITRRPDAALSRSKR